MKNKNKWGDRYVAMMQGGVDPSFLNNDLKKIWNLTLNIFWNGCAHPQKKKKNYKKKRKSNIISIWLKGVFFFFSCLNIFWIFKYCPSTFKNDARCPGNILRLLLKCFIAQTKKNNSYIYLVKNLPCIPSIFRFWKNRVFFKNIILYIVFTKNHEVNKVLYV